MTSTPSAAAAVRKTQREIPVVVLEVLGKLDESFRPTGASFRNSIPKVKRTVDITELIRPYETRGRAPNRLEALRGRDEVRAVRGAGVAKGVESCF